MDGLGCAREIEREFPASGDGLIGELQMDENVWASEEALSC